jgi:ribosomal protein L10
MPRLVPLVVGLLLLSGPAGGADEKVFSGPQVGEKLPPFRVRGVYDDAGKDLDFVKQAKGKPIVLIFVHDLNRPSAAMTRVLGDYAASRAKDGLACGIVWLTDDATEAENQLKRVRHAMPKAPIGISPDGKEGPGSYGLNRGVTLTILVGKDGKVTANFALVQPSLQADLPKVLEAVVKVAGGKVPKLEDLTGAKEMRRPEPNAKLTGMLRSLIQKTAKAEDVEKAAEAIEAYVKTNEAARKEVGRISRTIVDGGKVENYGTEKAQEYLKRWAKAYGERPKGKEKR